MRCKGLIEGDILASKASHINKVSAFHAMGAANDCRCDTVAWPEFKNDRPRREPPRVGALQMQVENLEWVLQRVHWPMPKHANRFPVRIRNRKASNYQFGDDLKRPFHFDVFSSI